MRCVGKHVGVISAQQRHSLPPQCESGAQTGLISFGQWQHIIWVYLQRDRACVRETDYWVVFSLHQPHFHSIFFGYYFGSFSCRFRKRPIQPAKRYPHTCTTLCIIVHYNRRSKSPYVMRYYEICGKTCRCDFCTTATFSNSPVRIRRSNLVYITRRIVTYHLGVFAAR